MSNEERKPRKYDLVLGGNNPPPVNGLVLGGIEGVKRKFEQHKSKEESIELQQAQKLITILEEAVEYGDVGKDWLYQLLETQTGETQWIVAVVLSKIANKPYQKFFKPEKKESELKNKKKAPEIIGILVKGTNEMIKIPDKFDRILTLVPNEKEQKIIEYFRNLIIKNAQNLQKWNNWREKYCRYMLYLRDIDLSSLKLLEIDLSKCNLVNANLENSNLAQSNLADSYLNHANLIHANLNDTYLWGAKLIKANLTKASLTFAILKYADIRKSNFTEANLDYVRCDGADFRGASLKKASFCDARLVDANFTKVIMYETNFSNADFRRSNISGLDFRGINIDSAVFAYAKRENTNFKGSYRNRAYFKNDDNYHEYYDLACE